MSETHQVAVGIRLNCDELVSGAYHTEDAYQILKRISDLGLIDCVDLNMQLLPMPADLPRAPLATRA